MMVLILYIGEEEEISYYYNLMVGGGDKIYGWMGWMDEKECDIVTINFTIFIHYHTVSLFGNWMSRKTVRA